MIRLGIKEKPSIQLSGKYARNVMARSINYIRFGFLSNLLWFLHAPHKTADDMDPDTVYECVVVGAGIEGSATAYSLVRKGNERVLLLEQVRKPY